MRYRDYAVWEGQQDLASDRDFWLEQLRNPPPPLVLADQALPTFAAGRSAFAVDGPLLSGLRGCAERHHTTVFTVFLTALFRALGTLTGQNDLLVGVADLGRSRAELFRLVGMFINLLPIRSAESVEAAHRRVTEARAHASYPLHRLQRELGLSCQVRFSYMAFDDSTGSLLESLPTSGRDALPFDLSIFANETDQAVNFSLEYPALRVQPDTIARVETLYLEALRSLRSV